MTGTPEAEAGAAFTIINWFGTRRHIPQGTSDRFLCGGGYGVREFIFEEWKRRRPEITKNWQTIPLCKNCMKRAGIRPTPAQPTTKPTVEALRRTIRSNLPVIVSSRMEPRDDDVVTAAVLALLPGRTEQEVRVEALKEAIAAIEDNPGAVDGAWYWADVVRRLLPEGASTDDR